MSGDLDQSPAVPFDLISEGPTFGFVKTYNPSSGLPPGGLPGQVQINNSGAFGGLTNAQLTALIQAFTSTLSGGVPASGGGTTNFLRADGLWAPPPGGGGGVPDGNKGDITTSGGGITWTINPGVVTYAKMQNVSAGNLMLGRLGGTGTVQELTGTQVTALLNVFTNTLAGLAPASGGGTANFLRADGTWAAPILGSGVSSVSNSDNSLTISPTTGAVVASINIANHNTWTTDQTFTKIFFSGPANGFGLNDTSSLAHNSGTFWSSNMHRTNRLFVGLSASIDGNNVPQSPTVLGAAYSPAFSQNAQFSAFSAMGLIAVHGVARASDWVTFSGGASQGTEAILGFGLNDDTTTSGSIAVGGNLIGIAVVGCTGITLGTQNDINSDRTPVTIDPFTGFPSGTTIATLATSGAYSGLNNQNVSAAYVVAQGGSGGVFNSGLVFMANSLSVLGGGQSRAIALPQNYAIAWYTSAGVFGGSIYVDPSGNMNINCSGVVKVNGVVLTVP